MATPTMTTPTSHNSSGSASKIRMIASLIVLGGMVSSFSLWYHVVNTSNVDGKQYWETLKGTVVDQLQFDQPTVFLRQQLLSKGVTTTSETAGAAARHKQEDKKANQQQQQRSKKKRHSNTTTTSSTRTEGTNPKLVLPKNNGTIASQRSHGNNEKQRGQEEKETTTTATAENSNNESNKDDTTSTDNDGGSSAIEDFGRLNVVLFYADDWTMRVLGKYDVNVFTPYIDELADQGMIFQNNCVTTSVCWISRASLVTGTYYARHLQNYPHVEELFRTVDWKQTLFPKMKSSGYFTGLMGKWHAPMPQKEMDAAFSMRRFYYGHHWYNGQHITDMNREHAITFLQERPKDRPFFLKVSFFATHAVDGHYPSFEPMNATRHTYYPNSKFIYPPKTATDEHWKRLPTFFANSEGRTRWKRRFEPDYFQDNVKDMYSMATEVDDAIGQVIQELKQQGVYNQTMIIFTTDNGNLQGEHGLTEKWYPFEESLRVPLVIYDPRMPLQMRGTTTDKWTLNIDLAPTILGAAGLQPSSFMQGRDLSQLYMNHKNPEDTSSSSSSWRQDFFYEFNMGNPHNASDHPWKDWLDASFALVTDEWKYVYWPQQNYEQLFHRSVDPYDEWDLLHKLQQQNNNTTFDAIQTTDEIYQTIKKRYHVMKERAQSGLRI